MLQQNCQGKLMLVSKYIPLLSCNPFSNIAAQTSVRSNKMHYHSCIDRCSPALRFSIVAQTCVRSTCRVTRRYGMVTMDGIDDFVHCRWCFAI